jgi:hypothetical protein
LKNLEKLEKLEELRGHHYVDPLHIMYKTNASTTSSTPKRFGSCGAGSGRAGSECPYSSTSLFETLEDYYTGESKQNLDDRVDTGTLNITLKKNCKNNMCYRSFVSTPEYVFDELLDFYKKILSVMPSSDPRTERLKSKFDINNSTLFEVDPQNGDSLTSYTVNKGEEMGLCLRNKNKVSDIIKNMDTIKFVFAHELSHIFTITTHHTPEFWNNFKWLLGLIYKNKLLPVVDYKRKPEVYCGLEIKHNPYLDDR